MPLSSSSLSSSSTTTTSIPLSSLTTAVKKSQENGEKMLEEKPPSEPISPPYVIPAIPLAATAISGPSNTSYCNGQETNFDHNDIKYSCCHSYMHIKLAARIVSIAYFCATISVIFLIIYSQNVTFAFYSIATSSFAFAVFGTLIYGIFKEKQAFILPYIIFQIISILCTILIAVIFVIGSAISTKMINSLAADIAGIRFDDDIKTKSDKQIFALLFVSAMIILLFIQLWFLDIISRFRNFILERENSFSLNLTSVLNNNTAFFNDLPSFYSNNFSTLKQA